jgi:hypothetical protein
MGTRSVTRFIEKIEDSKTKKVAENVICAIYQQFDGYPSGVGLEIAEFLKEFELVNGMSGDRTLGKIANGIGCLSAQFIAKFKTEAGNLYMTSPDDRQAYNYDIIVGWGAKPTKPIIRVDMYDENGKKVTFEGTPEEFIELVESEKIS